jgi:hypothetical protein
VKTSVKVKTERSEPVQSARKEKGESFAPTRGTGRGDRGDRGDRRGSSRGTRGRGGPARGGYSNEDGTFSHVIGHSHSSNQG